MKQYDIDVGEPAKQDILGLARYISAEAGANQAIRIVDEIEEAMLSLCNFPMRRALVQDERLAKKGYRAIGVKRNLIFYTVNEHTQTVTIIRVLSSRRDWAKLLSPLGRSPKMLRRHTCIHFICSRFVSIMIE
jgi:plasmid stabilization system protein ParE